MGLHDRDWFVEEQMRKLGMVGKSVRPPDPQQRQDRLIVYVPAPSRSRGIGVGLAFVILTIAGVVIVSALRYFIRGI